jgi:hypothetical protein
MNFYINIEKLKNLRITHNKDGRAKSQAASNSFINRDKVQGDRRSELLKRYNVSRKQYQSQEQLIYQSANRPSQEKDARQGRSRGRYNTDVEDRYDSSNRDTKNSLYKKTQNEMVIKDKTFIEGYLRGKQLGRGGFSKVW